MMITRIYTALLRLYPRQFRTDFGIEMQAVFEEATTTQQDWTSKALLLLRELRDLPDSILNAYLSNWLRGGNMSNIDEYIKPSTRWQAFWGILPFLAFGISSMIDKMDHIFLPHRQYVEMATYGLALVGLLIGWIRGFPLWSYSYLGWSLLLAWSNTNISIYGVYWEYQVWIPFGITVLTALLWIRSFAPLKKLLRDSWNDWTRLSLTMYTFIAFMFLIYDENHHTYLMILMIVSTLATAAGAWFFLRSATIKSRVTSIFGGFVAIAAISWVSEATWDWRAYYGVAEVSVPWYVNALRAVISLIFIAIILFWPAIVGIIHRRINRQTA
jgi:hypothetical protein